MLSENSDVIQIDTAGRQPTRNGEQTVPCGFSLDDRCSVDGRKRHENDKCGRKTAPFSFENGLVWTGPEFEATDQARKNISHLVFSVQERLRVTSSIVDTLGHLGTHDNSNSFPTDKQLS